MINTIHLKETLGQELSFDEFNLIITAMKLTNDLRWERIVKYTHVIRDKESGTMQEKVRTQLFFDDLIAIYKMDTRLRYDEDLLEKSLNQMEDFTKDMQMRDEEFYQGLNSKHKRHLRQSK